MLLNARLRKRVYSCAEICWSASRQALIFNRRQTQQRFSSSGEDGPTRGVHSVLHTAHLLGAGARSESTDFFAKSSISGATIGSAVDFFFMIDFTIVQKRSSYRRTAGNPGGLSDYLSTVPTNVTHKPVSRLRNRSNFHGSGHRTL